MKAEHKPSCERELRELRRSCEREVQKLRQMLYDVVGELDLSNEMIEEHGQLGTPAAELVRLVLERKDSEIRMLKAGMVCVEPHQK